MKRKQIIETIKSTEQWDLLIIGGGASGLGVALDAISRGLKTLLVEKYDFAKGTSSKSTKLIHGGVRYLQQGNIKLVREALREREYLLDKAPHNAHLQPFIIPFYAYWMGFYYFIGLKMYDILAGSRQIGKTSWLSRKTTLKTLPQIKKKGLKGGILYYDGKFDDARLCLDLVRKINSKGGICINYCPITKLKDEGGQLVGGFIYDTINEQEYEIRARHIVNATGVFADEIIRMDDKNASRKIIPSRGSHIVLDKKFIASNHAVMIPKTSDGRVLFAIPWNEKCIVGTTDILSEKSEIEPKITENEIQFILENAANYFESKPTKKDILSVFAGLRPLAAPEEGGGKTKEISRGHKIFQSEKGLITIIGGKWTTFRKMGQDVLDFLEKKNNIFPPSKSENIEIGPPPSMIKESINRNDFNQKVIDYFIDEELACTPEDILARRSRLLFLNAQQALDLAPEIINKMQNKLGHEKNWTINQLNQLETLINQYFLPPK
jgi:glycerol-3-phosphate dehydrogenase